MLDAFWRAAGRHRRFVIKVLVVDDFGLDAQAVRPDASAQQADFEVRFARNGVEALDQLEASAPDVVTLDVHMPQMDGLECLDRIMVERPCPVVMVSSLTAEGAEATLEALRLGAVDFIAKPDGAVSLRHRRDRADSWSRRSAPPPAPSFAPSLRLKERVRHRIGGAAPASAQHDARRRRRPPPPAASRARPATGWCWSARRPAGRRRWRRC